MNTAYTFVAVGAAVGLFCMDIEVLSDHHVSS